jgi:hypothetical protein
MSTACRPPDEARGGELHGWLPVVGAFPLVCRLVTTATFLQDVLAPLLLNMLMALGAVSLWVAPFGWSREATLGA